MQGDFHHWITLFNFFDDYLEKNVTPRSDLQLDWSDGKAEDPPFPKEEVDAILHTTSVILENCSNKHLYQSTEVNRAHTVVCPCFAPADCDQVSSCFLRSTSRLSWRHQ